jgi:Uma2 family endonuclease
VKPMVANSLYWTTADLDVMPDDGGWLRHEIIAGELFVTRAPHIRHQAIGGNIHFELEFWSRETKLGKPFQTPGVIFTPTDAVIPDVVWASQSRLDRGIDAAGHFTIAPELMVEILRQYRRSTYRRSTILLTNLPLPNLSSNKLNN